MTTRTPGKRGKLPVKPEGERFAIQYLSAYLKHPLPGPKYPVDVTGGIGTADWGMLANGPDPACKTHPDGLGDCSFAGRQHNRMAKAACYGQTETWETSDQLAAEYLKYDHGHDEGANLADLLLYWYKNGLIKGFAPVDHTSASEVDSAMAAFKGAYVGVSLTDDADELFSEGKPWTIADGQQPDPEDGHCIVKVKADGKNLDAYVTWGAEQPATEAWTRACLDEAWVIITSEDEAAKVDMDALLADIDALHGTGCQSAGGDTSDEPPAVSRERALLDEAVALAREIASSADRDIRELIAWAHSHGL